MQWIYTTFQSFDTSEASFEYELTSDALITSLRPGAAPIAAEWILEHFRLVLKMVNILLLKHQINTRTMLDKDGKFNLVKNSSPITIRSSWTLKAVSVFVQHGVGVYLMFNEAFLPATREHS